MDIIITYDLDSGWETVKEEAYKLSFYNIVNTTGGPRVLPNTALFSSLSTPLEALSDFELAVANAQKATGKEIRVEKLLVGTFDNWWVRSNRTE